MIRTFATALLLAGFSVPASQAVGPAQPQPNSGPEAYALSTAGRSYLGVDIRDVTKDRMPALKLKEERGVEVTMVDRDAPAGKAGIREGDVIMDFNGEPVESEAQLRRLIRETPPGRTVSLGISRDGNPLKLNVQLAEHSKVVAGARLAPMPPLPPLPPLPAMPDLANRMDVPGNIYIIRDSGRVGLQTENLTRQLGEFFGVKDGEGVLVRSVEKGSPAEKAGVKAGDVIVRAGDEKLADRGDFARVMRKHRAGGKLNLGIVRDKHEQNLTLEIPARNPADSSANFAQSEELEALLDSVDALAPEIDSATRQITALKLQGQLEKAMQGYKKGMGEYDKAMRQYDDQFKDLNKKLEQMQKQFQKEFHQML